MYQNHASFVVVCRIRVAPSSIPSSLDALSKCVNRDAFLNVGSSVLIRSLREIRALRPVASTTTHARRSFRLPSSYLALTPTARPPSKRTS